MAEEDTKRPLCIVPVYISKDEHLTFLDKCCASMRDPKKTSTPVDILLVDDGSPLDGVEKSLKLIAKKYAADLHMKGENTGFSATVNIGLRKALEEKRVAVLINLDIEFLETHPDWLEVALEDEGDLIGARLLFGNGLIQHAGVMFSRPNRWFDHRYKMAPHNLPEANVRFECPVTGALQVIKPNVLESIGLYDETFKLAYEDVDYCLRANAHGLKVIYNPKVTALHFESLVRGKSATEKTQKWYAQSWAYLCHKYQHVNMIQFCMPLDRRREEHEGIPGKNYE